MAKTKATRSNQVRLVRQACWVPAADFAHINDCTVRHLQNLEHKGLPVRIKNRKRQYPMPDANIWMIVYRWRLKDREKVGWLSLDEAHAEYTLEGCKREMRSLGRPKYDEDGHRLLHPDDVIPYEHQVLGVEDVEEIPWILGSEQEEN